MLTDWWAAMGVDVDTGFVDAVLASLPARQESEGLPAVAEPVRRLVRNSPAERASQAARLAEGAGTMAELEALITGFDAGALSAGAGQAVVCEGVPGADLMVIGDSPDDEDDRLGRPFAGRPGLLLDGMLAAIGRSRAHNVFISHMNYWRVPGGRNPDPEELAICRPFVNRMIDLARPRLVLAVGAVAAGALLGRQETIMKLRGKPYSISTPAGFETVLVAILHPQWLLSRPQDKSRAWRDLLLVESLIGPGA